MARYNGHTGQYGAWSGQANGGNGEQNGNGGEAAGSSEQCGRQSPTAIFNPFYTGRPRTPVTGQKHYPIDRQEIMRRIKSRESRPSSPEVERTSNGRTTERGDLSPAPASRDALCEESLASARYEDSEVAGMQIERPRSALHRGDFREKEDIGSALRFGGTHRDEVAPSLSTSPVAPWHADFPSAIFRQSRQERPRPPSPPAFFGPTRPRATSHASLASTFVYKPPTSPLVQSSRPDTPEPSTRRPSRSPDKSRRHTFSPPSLHHFRSALEYPTSARNHDHPQPLLRTERVFPYQAHQPRRSLNSFSSLPQTPAPGTRRPSLVETSLHHAPMVGSYEESILRGRMSTTPSKPLNFVAQIGVLGKGDCKPNLRCPPHVTVPFPAVFYSYASVDKATDQPSPYVGMVDLDHHLPSAETSLERRRQRLQHALGEEGSRVSSQNREDGSASDAKAKRRQRHKQKRRSGSPKTPPGGSYRIPQQGQLQVILKNPNKTAVKLFLVPYDLSDMEPGQKTFIRQRSYSAGPIIDMPLSSRNNLGTDRPEAALSASGDPNDRPMLRYLIHLHICCPCKGRYFLYKSMRVVFANRVPDGKEKLRNEIQLPEPRYSTYKANREVNGGFSGRSATPSDAVRRRGNLEQPPVPPFEEPWSQTRHFAAHSLPSLDYGPGYGKPLQSLPFDVTQLSPLHSRPASRETSDGLDADSEMYSRSTLSSPTSGVGEPTSLPSSRALDDPFSFERDDNRQWHSNARSDSLLSRRLRDLAFQEPERL